MGPIDLLWHLLGFAAPAFGLAALLVSGTRLLMSQRARGRPFWLQLAVNLAVGLAVLLGGLLVTGHDGRIATYAVLVLACASCQWLLLRGWR